ncbi:hypothetical protein C8R46DRAFT_1186098 [Mycena filopes]|nr:hypothetical protein C8R46DRAFT_1186098 [Mycena filopes]
MSIKGGRFAINSPLDRPTTPIQHSPNHPLKYSQCLLPLLLVTPCVVLHGPRSQPTARESSRNGSSPARRQLLPQTSPLPASSSPPSPPPPPNGPRSPATRHSPSCDPSFTPAALRPSRPAPPCRAPKSTAFLAKSRAKTPCGAHIRLFARSKWGR